LVAPALAISATLGDSSRPGRQRWAFESILRDRFAYALKATAGNRVGHALQLKDLVKTILLADAHFKKACKHQA
jgi:hypothetical protein